MNPKLCLAAFFMAAVVGASPARATTITVGGAAIPATSINTFTYSPSASSVFNIGDPSNTFDAGRQAVIRDDTVGPWLKSLNFGASVPINAIFTIKESLKIGAAPSWSDWHESIEAADYAAGWRWLDATVPTLMSFGLAVNPTVFGTISLSALDFVFAALPPGTLIDIQKFVQYQGTSPFTGTLEIFEYPTGQIPEPASLGLFACGIAALFLRRRRAQGA